MRNDCRQFLMPIEEINNLPRDKKFYLLDVGAGVRMLKEYLPSNIYYVSLDYEGNQDIIHNLDNLPLPIKSRCFDIIVCLETLEHTIYPDKVMKELLRIAKPNAIFFISMPNEYNFYARLNFLFGKKTDFQKTFRTTEKHLHVHSPRVQDIISFASEYLDIERIDYQWNSRQKGALFSIADWIINNVLKRISKALYSRTVIIKGVKR